MFVHEVASDEFILIKSDWTVLMARQLIESLQPPHVIVHRLGLKEYYYLYTREEALARLRGLGGDVPVNEAFRLHEFEATPTLDIFDEAEEAPDRVVVLDEGRLSGFLDLTLPPSGPAWISPTRGERAPTLGAQEPIPRALLADFPEKVPLEEVASLLVSLSAERPLAPGLPLALPIGSRVDVLVQPQKGFVLETKAEGSLVIGDEAETLPLQFRLRAVETGLGKIRVLAFHEGSPLGALVLAPTVPPAAAGEGTGKSRSYEKPISSLQVSRASDLQLLILEGRSGGNPAFTIFLTAADPNLGLHFKPFGPIELRTPPLAYFNDFFQGIENLSLRTAEEGQYAEARLSSKGLSLFNSLFPDDLKVLLWELKERITTVEVVSQEPWIPWELCKLEGKVNGQFEEGPFLCEAYAITRWIPGIGSRTPSLGLRNIGLVVPSDSNLPFAPAEGNYLRSLANSARRVTQIPASFLEMRRALASGEYDGWHFTGHGLFSSEDPNRSGITLEGGFTFTPDELSGEIKNLGKARPLIFFNACQIGRSALGLTDIGGFAAQFLRAGAAAFVGAYWSIFDEPALIFAQSFYDNLLAGEAIGQATRLARKEIQPLPGPTWLAYTVYADPSAVVA